MPPKTPTKVISKDGKDVFDASASFKVAAEGKDQHGKSARTRESYKGHIKRGVEFLAKFAAEERSAEETWKAAGSSNNQSAQLSTDNEHEIPTDEEAQMDPNFCNAFTGPPKRCTPSALVIFLAHKCFTKECGKSTASAIHAAFLDHYASTYVSCVFHYKQRNRGLTCS